jgi:iron complex transport system ATP-binding protein
MTGNELEVCNLSLSYGSVSRSIISGLDLVIPRNQITVLVGPNGCGKSTLIRGLARILPPAVGAVLLDGEPIHSLPTREVAMKIGILPQAPSTPEGITVAELVQLGRYPHQNWWQRLSGQDLRIIQSSIVTAGLEDLADTAVDILSGGQKQRAWIAMALAQETPIMLLDEPTTFLDLAHQIEVLDLLWTLNERNHRTIVMVLHDLNQACRYAHHIVMLQKGKVVMHGSPYEVISEETVSKVFGVECRIIMDPITGTPLCLPIGRRGAQKMSGST